jgi:hypothetical protein
MDRLEFDARGYLPAGIHPIEWPELVARFGFTRRRAWLLDGLKAGALVLQSCGCTALYVNGSFASAKPEPNDYDACWRMEGVQLNELARAEPVFFDFANGRAAQKARFRGEFFPADLTEGGSGKTFLQFFQTDPNTGEEKGLLELRLSEALP